MSKKHRKVVHHSDQPRSSSPRWGMLVGGVSLAIGLLFLVIWFTSSGEEQKTDTPDVQTDPNFTPQVIGQAQLEVDQDLIDFGEVKFEKMVNAVFNVKNVGDQPLVIENSPQVELVEGC